MKKVAALALLFSSLASEAQDLNKMRFVAEDNINRWYIRLDRQTFDGDVRTAWFHSYLKGGAVHKIDGKSYKSGIHQYSYRCPSLVAEGQWILYDYQGDTIRSAPGSGVYRQPIPDTVGDAMLQAVCSAATTK